ncbi:hypothetical protein QUQ_2335 [Clostridioides difficile P68]|nr:hypothetical protein QUQ_2335 [Clostridioides difficile P68]
MISDKSNVKLIVVENTTAIIDIYKAKMVLLFFCNCPLSLDCSISIS